MKNLTALRGINIGGAGRVPEFISYMKDLESLDLSHNRLGALPDFIGGLTKLKSLILHSTWITELPAWLGNLKNLEELDLSSNCFPENTDEVWEEVYKILPPRTRKNCPTKWAYLT
jgi:Leucine-rich repeat (LRR) protein